MTTLDDLEKDLDDLLTADLERLADEFLPIVGSESASAAAFAAWWVWRLIVEVGDRRGQTRPPEPPKQTALNTAELYVIRRSFGEIADDTKGAQPLLAAWCRGLVDLLDQVLFDAEFDEVDDDGAVLRAYVNQQRRVRRHGTPGETSGLARWSKVSRPDQDDQS